MRLQRATGRCSLERLARRAVGVYTCRHPRTPARRPRDERKRWGETMPGATETGYNGTMLPAAEVSALAELAGVLQATGYLPADAPIPVVPRDEMGRHRVALCVENNAVVALAVRYCGLPTLPDSLGRLTGLRHLDLAGNQLAALPAALGNLAQLQRLYLEANRLAALPEWLGDLARLEALYLNGNEVAALPDGIARLANLRTLNLYGNRLTAVPARLSRLAGLADLSLGHNRLTELPASFWGLTGLQVLNL